MNDLLKIAIAPLGSCSGCDVALVDIGEAILDLPKIASIVYWPTAADGKIEDLEGMDSIDVAIVHGMVGNSEQERVLRIIESRAKYIVAFGTCAYIGGIFGLRNAIADAGKILRTAYVETQSTENKKGVIPSITPPQYEVEMPKYYDFALPLRELCRVHVFVPGCPPVEEQILHLVSALKNLARTGNFLPEGTVIAGDKSVCTECPREKPENVTIKRLIRRFELKEDNGKCFLVQGVLCMGPATRSGCDARCIKANVPCRGCFGPPSDVKDQGAKMLSALASSVYADEEKDVGEEGIA
ncbi:MAG: oxidoreductase, partial [Thermoplasmata archaeon]